MIRKIVKSVREYKLATFLTPLFVALETIMEVIIPFLMAILIDKGITNSNMNVIYITGIILVLCALLSLTFGYLSGYFAAVSSSGFAKNLRHDMYYKVQDFSFYNVDKFSSSSIVTRLTTDVSNVQQAYQMITRIAVRAPLNFFFSLIMAFIINAKVSLVFLCIIPVLIISLFYIASKARKAFEKLFKTYDILNNKIQENVRGIRVVKAFVREDEEIRKFEKTNKKIFDYSTLAEKILAFNSPIMQFCMYLAIILISWFSSRLIITNNMTTGELTSLITYSSTILSSLMMLSMIYVMITMAIPSVKRCVEILDEIPDIKNPRNGIKEVKTGSIEFKNVDFSYVKNLDKLSLKNINLKIKKGETIGIIGATGSSKTTLINLIPRLYDVTSGEVLVDNIDVRKYDLKALRDNVAVVLQKNVLFKGTIYENICWGKENASLEEVRKVAKIANADEFIMSFPDKYDTILEQGGVNLSGGQRQRVCIARALIKKPKILILDDSTSAVDTKTDANIREELSKLKSCTKIIIAQRVQSVMDADRIIVMENGTINAFDTIENLLKDNEIFKDIYYSQLKGGKING